VVYGLFFQYWHVNLIEWLDEMAGLCFTLLTLPFLGERAEKCGLGLANNRLIAFDAGQSFRAARKGGKQIELVECADLKRRCAQRVERLLAEFTGDFVCRIASQKTTQTQSIDELLFFIDDSRY